MSSDPHTGTGERLDQALSAPPTPSGEHHPTSRHAQQPAADAHSGHQPADGQPGHGSAHSGGHGGARGGGHGGAHGGGHGDHAAQFRDRFWLSLLLTLPVVGFSHMFSDLLGYTLPGGTGWISPVLGIVIFLYGGGPFLTGAVAELKARQPGMMLLISLAITVAFVASTLTSLGVGGLDLDFWWELALLVTIMLLGHWLEMRALGQASGALDALAALLPDDAERVDDAGQVSRVSLAELVEGDTVLVRSGGRVPADGVITEGEAELDESMITGESRAVAKAPGDRVVAAPSPPTARSGCASTRWGRAPRWPASAGSSSRPRAPLEAAEQHPDHEGEHAGAGGEVEQQCGGAVGQGLRPGARPSPAPSPSWSSPARTPWAWRSR